MKKLLSFFLILSLLPVCSALAAEASVQKAGTARVYLGTLQYPEELTVWHADGWDDVPFVSARDYLELCLKLAGISDYKLSRFGSSYLTLRCGDGSAMINADNDTVTLSYPEEYMYMWLLSPAPGSAVQYSEAHDTDWEPGKDITIRLGNYGLDILFSGKDPLLPFQAAEVLFGMSMTGYALVYNGTDFFDVSYLDDTSACVWGADNPGPYQQALYSGPFADREALTGGYSRYYYGSVCLMMDLLHGRRAETGYASLADFAAEQGLDDLLTSMDPQDLLEGVDRLLNLCFDTAHDGFTGDFGVFGCRDDMEALREARFEALDSAAQALLGGGTLPAEDTRDAAEETGDGWRRTIASDSDARALARWLYGDYSSQYGPRGQEMLVWTCLMDHLRPEGGNSLRILGDTAFITFDSFDTDDSAYAVYSRSLPGQDDWQNGTFGFFYGCFEIISRAEGVRRVVVDVSSNGGGDVSALVEALGFLSPDGEVCLTSLNTFSGTRSEDWFHVDTNLDGVMDSRDGWGDRYDFYIVTSGSTYSCASALAFYAAKQGFARVIGRQCGGGDCVVNLWYDAAGILSYYSGNLKLGAMENGKFVSLEGNIPMTAEWGSGVYAVDAPWFSPEGIADFIDRLEAAEEDGAA